jgi:uncharacterized membrane protein
MRFLYHPLLVHFPIALWLTSALCDLLYLSQGDRFYQRAAHLLIGLGLLGAAVSIVTGFVDFRPLVAEGIGQSFVDKHRAHGLLAYGSTAVYVVSFVARRRPTLSRATIAALMVLGAGLIAATGYIGGEVRSVM